MNPTLEIIEYLIEQYFDNNGGREDYDWKEVKIAQAGDRFTFEWICYITSRGHEVWNNEYFIFRDGEKITNLEKYVNEVIERILNVPYFDERLRNSDPTIG